MSSLLPGFFAAVVQKKHPQTFDIAENQVLRLTNAASDFDGKEARLFVTTPQLKNKKILLCRLGKEINCYQWALANSFNAMDEQIELSTNSEGSIHVTGNVEYIPDEEGPEEGYSEDSEMEDEEYEKVFGMQPSDEDEEEEENRFELIESDEESIPTLIPTTTKKEKGDEAKDTKSIKEKISVKKETKATPTKKEETKATPTKKEETKAEKKNKKKESKNQTPVKEKTKQTSEKVKPERKENAQLKDQKKEKAKTAIATPDKSKDKDSAIESGSKKRPQQEEGNASKKMKTMHVKGIQIEDISIGTGKVAKSGNRVGVLYKGWLMKNNKQFDAATNRHKPFKFRLGCHEVISGWDIGVQGMKVGGKRRLVIPAEHAYGKRGAKPQIPPNATLKFEIELIHC